MDKSISLRPEIKDGDKVRLKGNQYATVGAVEMQPGTTATVHGVFPDPLLPIDVVSDDFPNAGSWPLAANEFEIVREAA